MINQEALLERARAARDMAYAPYSQFNVGAALMTTSGEVILGCNVENASFGLTICAERTAMVSAVAAGHRDFRAVAIVSSHAMAAAKAPCSPCGACRQFMAEFSPAMEIILETDTGGIQALTLSELLPHQFSLVSHPTR